MTDLPSGVTSAAGWSRAEWIEQTLPVWKKLVEPVAEHVVAAMGNALPAEAKAMAGPLIGLLGQAGGAMFGSQVGQALAGLASEVLSTSDIGLPLAPVGKAALLPTNVAAFAEGLDVPADDVRLYLAIREAAHQRLFAHVPWLSAHLLAAVEDFGRGTTHRRGRHGVEDVRARPDQPRRHPGGAGRRAVRAREDADPAGRAGAPRDDPRPRRGLGRRGRQPGHAPTGCRTPTKLQEIVRRRRAAGGPAEDAFAALVGLEMRPRRLRDAATLWGSLRVAPGRRGARRRSGRHPDLLPTATDLDDPLGFGENPELEEAAAGFDDNFDAALAELLDEDGGRARRPDAGPSGPDRDRTTDRATYARRDRGVSDGPPRTRTPAPWRC